MPEGPLRNLGGRNPRLRSVLASSSTQNRNKIPAAMHNPFDADRVLANAEQNHIIADCGQSRFRAKKADAHRNDSVITYL